MPTLVAAETQSALDGIKPVGRAAPGVMAKPRLRDLHPEYFVQQIEVGTELVGRSRLEVFSQICEGRRVLHVGCVDWPITDIRNSIHVALDPVCAHLDGLDINDQAFPMLRPHVRGSLFSDWGEVNQSYDMILVPEVMEHVGNVEGFLGQLDRINATSVILTVPDAYSCFHRHFELEGDRFTEVVHPDHNCWYTPYTLANTLKKYTNWKLQGIWFFNRISLLAILSKG